MSNGCIYIFFLILIIIDKYAFVESNSNNIKENNELYLTKIKESYNFLDASLNAINDKGNSYKTVLNKVSTVDLKSIHNEVLKNLKFDKLKEVMNIKNYTLNCILESILHMIRSLPAIAKEILEYNEFCSSIEAKFSFLYSVDRDYKEKIEDCSSLTTDSIINNYFSFNSKDINLILEKYKKNPQEVFERFNSIVECFDEFYNKVTHPFDEHVKETQLYKEFMIGYKKPANTNYVDYLKEFLDSFNKWKDDQIMEFFDELYYIYSTNDLYISCFYLF